MHIEERIDIQAPPEAIFAVYQDVARWNTWDPDTKSSSLNGPFEVGTKGRLAPTKGQEIGIELTSVVPGRSFTCVGGVPLFRMVFDHELIPSGKATTVVHRITFSGALSFVLGRIVGAQVRKGLPLTLASLKRLVESQA